MPKPGDNKCVLLVGSEIPPLHEILSCHNIDLLTLSDSDQMLEVLAGQTVDALVTDIDVSSIDLLSTVRERYKDLIIIVMVGFADGHLAADTRLGNIATAIVAQPFDLMDISLAIRYSFQRNTMCDVTAALNEEYQTRSSRILVAEDDYSCRRLLEAQLSKQGYDSTCVENGRHAIEAIESGDFDILLTDIQMPEIDGIELTRRVKELNPRMPVIVISASGEVEASIEALRAGAYCYVVKPVNFEELAIFMDRAMLSDRLEREVQEHNALLVERTEELRETFDALRAESDLHQASRLSTIKRLAANVAHELKNPINSISASFFYVRNKIPETLLAGNPKIARHCNIVEAQIERSRMIIDGMMTFANPGEIQMTSVQVNDLLTEAVELALPVQHQIDVRFALDPGLPLIETSESKLKIVFSNLAINAAKAMKNEGVLTISTQMDPVSGVTITFADTGPGLPASIIHKVFDPFFTTDQQAGGTGLGLAICRETVKQCGGDITAGNAPHGGAVFSITLPMMHQEEKSSHSLIDVVGVES